MTYEEIKDLDSLRKTVEALGRRISAPEEFLPTYNKSVYDAHPHIEHNASGFHYVVVERGKELKRVTTSHISDLLYLAFQDVTFNMACRYELNNRIKGQDCRRGMWKHQLELLEQLDASWRINREENIKEILLTHPYNDNSGLRLDLFAELKQSGLPQDEAWQKACERYPLLD